MCHTGSTKKKYCKGQRVGGIDISTYQYRYVKCRGGHCGDFGGFRSTVVFLNNNLLVLEVTIVVRRQYSYYGWWGTFTVGLIHICSVAR